jgi:hypothetical protein
MYSPLAQDQIRTNQEQLRRQVATAHARVALRRSPAATGSEPTGLPALWLTMTGPVRRGGRPAQPATAQPATTCRPA